jgi:class 3 adenylate cyclase
MSRTSATPTQLGLEDLIFALTSVSAATAAGRAHGDLESAAVLSDYYALVAAAVALGEGRVVKVIGDGVLIVFPIHRAKDAVNTLRALQSSATRLWSAFDTRCRVQVKVGSGPLAAGPMGPPGAERFDVYGTALNDLFKAPMGDFFITPELAQLLK